MVFAVFDSIINLCCLTVQVYKHATANILPQITIFHSKHKHFSKHFAIYGISN